MRHLTTLRIVPIVLRSRAQALGHQSAKHKRARGCIACDSGEMKIGDKEKKKKEKKRGNQSEPIYCGVSLRDKKLLVVWLVWWAVT
jgi:hypothetical protein